MKNIDMSVAALFDGGWRAEDRDDLKAEYELTDDEVDEICEGLESLAESNRKAIATIETDAGRMTIYFNGPNGMMTAEGEDRVEYIEDKLPADLNDAADIIARLYSDPVWGIEWFEEE